MQVKAAAGFTISCVLQNQPHALRALLSSRLDVLPVFGKRVPESPPVSQVRYLFFWGELREHHCAQSWFLKSQIGLMGPCFLMLAFCSGVKNLSNGTAWQRHKMLRLYIVSVAGLSRADARTRGRGTISTKMSPLRGWSLASAPGRVEIWVPEFHLVYPVNPKNPFQKTGREGFGIRQLNMGVCSPCGRDAKSCVSTPCLLRVCHGLTPGPAGAPAARPEKWGGVMRFLRRCHRYAAGAWVGPASCPIIGRLFCE